MAHTVVLLLCAGMVGLLAFLTLSVAAKDGVTLLVVVSFVVIAVLGFGVLGALTHPPDE
jgi:hypothetical protein